MTEQLTLYGGVADPSAAKNPVKPVERKYRWHTESGHVPTANIVDQLALVVGKNKSDTVAMAVRLAALYVKLAGPEAFRAISGATMPADLLALIREHSAAIYKEPGF